MNISFLNRPLFRILWPPVYGSFVYLLILLLNNNLDQLKESFFGQELYFSIILTYLVFEAIRLSSNVALRKKEREIDFLIIVYLILINLIITALIVALCVNIYFKAILGFSSWNLFSVELGIFLVVYFFSALFYTSITISSQYLFRENFNKLQQEQILKENLELELLKFKNEINPDLLYDSLESLISLIHKNAGEAEEYIDKMALVYRNILSSRNSELVSIKQELKTAGNIVSLLNIKYNNNISIKNNIDQEYLDHLIIPGSLSNIIETIVRNTIISNYQPLLIQMEAGTDRYLVISHILNEKLRPVTDEKYARIQNAYTVYTEKPLVSVKAYGENFIKIPLLQLKGEPA